MKASFDAAISCVTHPSFLEMSLGTTNPPSKTSSQVSLVSEQSFFSSICDPAKTGREDQDQNQLILHQNWNLKLNAEEFKTKNKGKG